MAADDNTELELTFTLKLSLKRSPFIVKRLDERRGADVFEEIARRQARELLKRWTMKKKSPLPPHGV